MSNESPRTPWDRPRRDRGRAFFGTATALALVIAGALGNIIDRFLYGHVVDYVLFHTASWSFAVFNLADACISVGAAAIFLNELVAPKLRDR